jgi:dTDP-4-amino-4,6-dideoxygalactose transaminase
MQNQKNIPILIPSMPKYEELENYLKRIDENQIYSNFGPLNIELLTRLAAYFDVDVNQLATASNATLGLQGAISTSGSERSGHWSIPSWTFTATAAAAIASGIEFSFTDVDLQGRIIPDERSTSIVDVLPFGDDLAINRLPGKIELVVVDAAASFDALKSLQFTNSKRVGIVVSLHATKLLGAGEGGVFISNDAEWVSRFKKWTNFGFSDGAVRESEFVGSNAKLSEYAAAIALASLDSWEVRRAKLRELNGVALDISLSSGLSPITALQKNYATPYWIVETESRIHKLEISERLKSSGISFRDWWAGGCHKMPAYRNVPTTELRNTELLSEIQIGLPFHNQLSSNDLNRIKRALL